ncbi:MAG: exodeoxyribonuclease V subunit alpha [gamma proteobacterium symbiont of Taylorina sp.]|nr:exodeoxyribonuclease V subunit alpha [gamma proteobacterium symbiont of Taylorina sp.]
MIYSDSHACQQQLNSIEAIDYFMARQLTAELGQADNRLLFHLILALQWSLRQGHSCLPLNEVMDKTYWLDPEKGQSGYYFPSLTEIKRCLDDLNISADDNTAIVFDNQMLYLRRYWQFEVEIARALKERLNLTVLNSKQQSKAKAVFSSLFPPNLSDTKTDWQQVAAANAPGRRLSIISGGPGTGKTYTVTRLLAVLQAVHDGQLKILMAAPTGKAAQRLKESIADAKVALKTNNINDAIIRSIPEDACTLHRLLGFRPQSLKLVHDSKHPLKCDVLLIDEVSMIDLAMMARVLRALPDTSILILLGDADQLPSVETGNLLADLTCQQHSGYLVEAVGQIQSISGQKVLQNKDSHYSHLTLLKQSRRYGRGEISALAIEVINAEAQLSWKRLMQNKQKIISPEYHEKEQLSYFPDSLFESWLTQVCEYYFLKISTADDLSAAFFALASFRILVSKRAGRRGVEQLNQAIEQRLYHQNKAIHPGKNYQGRPVMVTRNSYSTNLFNGDIGLIWPDDNGKLAAWFEKEEGTFRHINLSRLPSIETVYSMTIHKTQGSEFNHVAIVLPQQVSALLSPELLYTGLTRTKEHCYIITSEPIWKAALGERTRRFSGLKCRLAAILK